MMILIWLLGGFFLAFSFGRNTIANVFGTAIGTGALSKTFCVLLMCLFILIGVFSGGTAINGTIDQFLFFTSPVQVFSFSLLLAFIICGLTYFGLPVSIAHIGMGGLIGWSFGVHVHSPVSQIYPVALAWIVSPAVSLGIAFCLYKVMRWFLKKCSIPLLYKDIFVRFNLIWIGCVIAYTLGQNNFSVLTAPFVQIFPPFLYMIILSFVLFILLGALSSSKKVIKTWSKGMFPLSSFEAMLMGLSAACTMFLFSLKLSFISAVPVSSAAALIGGIVGISLAKGGQGLHIKTLVCVASSWVWAPLLSGLLSYFVSSIIFMWGV